MIISTNMHRRIRGFISFFLLLILIAGCAQKPDDGETEKKETTTSLISPPEERPEAKSRILYVNSYDEGYGWSDGIEKGLHMALTDGNVPFELEILRMDTKRNEDNDYYLQAGEAVKNKVIQWKPDILLGSDDNFIRFAVVPYRLYDTVPLIFSGVNWDASAYNLPHDRVTGMLEIDPFRETIEMMEIFARGNKLGMLGRDDISNRKSLENSERILGIRYDRKVLVRDFETWKAEYLKLQDSMDMVYLFNTVGLEGWDNAEAEKFVMENTRLPTGTAMADQINIALLGKVKVPEEQGWWMGKKALEYLQGREISEIPWQKNSHFRLLINMPLANHLGFQFSTGQLEEATLWDHYGETP